MKKGFYAILAALAVFALVMTACPTDEGTKTTTPTPPPENVTSAVLSSLQLEGGTAAVPESDNYSTGMAEFYQTTDPKVLKGANVSISKLKTAVEITLNFVTNSTATAKYILQPQAVKTAITDADFDGTTAKDYNRTTKPKETLADGDKLFIRVISGNGANTRYYGFEVWAGRDASLKDDGGIVFTDTLTPARELTAFTKTNLGEPQDSVADLDLADNSGTLGKYQFPISQAATGFKVKAVTSDDDASAKLSTDGTNWNITATTPVVFKEGDFLYVEVTSGNGDVIQYYKIELVLKRVTYIAYGAPTDLTITAGAATDTVWDSVAWLNIDRWNTTEGQTWKGMDEADLTHGRAKLLWDPDGVWVYAQVWEKSVSAAPGNHEQSSVELFINENFPLSSGAATTVTGDTQQNGGQYRLGANGERTGAPSVAVTAFNSINESNNYKGTMPTSYQTGTKLTTGYTIIFHAPWRFPNLYPLKNNKQISLELQINATGDGTGGTTAGSRAGVLNWNNANSNSYSSLTDYGEAFLDLGSNTIGPQRPVISKQPASGKVELNATSIPSTVSPLTVEATSVDGGTLSYQWYKTTDATAGTAITNATTNSLTLDTTTLVPTDAAGEFYFYVAVTNNKGGVASKPNNSARATIEVYDPNAVANTVELAHAGITGWGTDDGVSGIIITTGLSNYNTFKELPIAKNLDRYTRLEIRYNAYIAGTEAGTFVAAAPVTGVNSNDIFVQVNDNTGTDKGNFGYNASGILTSGSGAFEGVYYTFTTGMQSATYGGSAKFEIKLKPGTNTDGTNSTIKKIILKSVAIVTSEPIELDLSLEVQNSGWAGSGQGTRVPVGYDAVSGNIVWNYPSVNDTARAAVALTVPQQTRLLDIDVKQIDVVTYGTAAATAGGGAATGTYRFFIGNPSVGSNFAYSTASNGGVQPWADVGSATGVKVRVNVSPQGGPGTDSSMNTSYILLSASPSVADTITITKIQIYPVVW